MKKRVVVTGLGMLSPVGNCVESSWNNILKGVSGVAPIDRLDASELPVKIAASVKDFQASEYLEPKESRKFDLFIQYGLAAAIQAIKDADLQINSQNAQRVGVCLAAGLGGTETIERNHAQMLQRGARRVSPFLIPGSIINMFAGQLSIMYGIKGPNLSVVTACTTGVHNIGVAARLIESGDADIMLAGGAEMATTPLTIAGFAAAKALSGRNQQPQQASRPWDKDRDGFVLGDGAGVMVLESLQSAEKRGAKIYAELTGFGMSGDAYHMTSPPEDGQGAALAMQNALQNGNISPQQIDYINAHGTSTMAGDLAETQAVKSVFAEHAYQLKVSSTKSMTGHLLGAAGSVEAIFSILAIRDQVAPPTINLDNPDENCDLNYVAHTAQQGEINHVLCNSFGFGGTNGSLLFSKPE